jgi:hypothetical protein
MLARAPDEALLKLAPPIREPKGVPNLEEDPILAFTDPKRELANVEWPREELPRCVFSMVASA